MSNRSGAPFFRLLSVLWAIPKGGSVTKQTDLVVLTVHEMRPSGDMTSARGKVGAMLDSFDNITDAIRVHELVIAHNSQRNSM